MSRGEGRLCRRERHTPAQVGLAYRLRWLLFKEWKSYANLHAFDTGKAGITSGLADPSSPPRLAVGLPRAQHTRHQGAIQAKA